jgi:hypothetical protein
MQHQLSRRAITALLHGRHASVGGKTVSKRARHLARIAAAYTRDELLAERGVGAAVATEIQQWLEAQRLSLRHQEPKVVQPLSESVHLSVSTAE